MNRDEITRRTAEHTLNKLSGEHTGHDWFHTQRVWKNARHIAGHEPADLFVVELAALLHDIADWKFADGDDSAGEQEARRWLTGLNVERDIIDHVCEIIRDISFKGAGVTSAMRTVEGKIVQDADRLDALGAIGIARAFAYGGHKGSELHNPESAPVLHSSFEEYKKGRGTTINHFHEKLLLLRDRMNTETGRRMATGRHRFMEEFLRRFDEEWDGMPWKCPTCKREFRNRNQAHSCIVTRAEDHWAQSEKNVGRVCEKLLRSVRRFGDVRISPVKNGIMVASASTFLAVKPKKSWVDIEFVLDREVNEYPVHKTIHHIKTRWAHFVRLEKPADVNTRLLDWLKAAFNCVNSGTKVT